MTNRELRKLKRTELIELMLMQSRELDEQRAQRKELEEQLEGRELKLQEAGSIAEAAMELNHVFAAAQSAANQYLENIKTMQADTESRCKARETEAEEQCKQREDAAERRCSDLLEEAKRQIDEGWETIDSCLTAWEAEYPELSELLRECRGKLKKARDGEEAEAEDEAADWEASHPELVEPLQECRDKLAEANSGEGAEADETEENA